MNDTPKSAHDANLLDLLVVLVENLRLLVFGSVAAGLLTLCATFLLPTLYTATTRVLPPQQSQGAAAILGSQLGALAGVAGLAGIQVKNLSDLYVALLKSRTIADRLIDRFDLMKRYDEELRQDARETLERRTNITANKDGLIAIEVDDEDPQVAADLANAYVDELFRLNSALALTEAQQRRAFFEKQLTQTSENLKSAQQALHQAGIPETLIKSSPEAVVESIARLKAQVTAQEIKLATMSAYLTENSPEYRLARNELQSLKQQLVQAEKNQPAHGPGRSEYLNRYRDFKYQETLFELMAKQYELAKLDEAREGALVQVVDAAIPPERKSKPKRALLSVLASFVAGLLLLLFVLARDSLRAARVEGDGAAKLHRLSLGMRRLVGK